jgi:hypothetical protein
MAFPILAHPLPLERAHKTFQPEEEVRAKGVIVEKGEDSLEKIAKANKITPMELYAIIKKFDQQPPVVIMESYTPEMVDEKFSGTGIGKKTLAEICKETGFDIGHARDNLLKNNIEMKDDETLKTAVEKRKVNPIEVLKVILVDNYKLK